MAPVGLKFFTSGKFKMEKKIFRKTEEAPPRWTWDVKPGVVQLGEAWSLQAARGTSGNRDKSEDIKSCMSEDSYSCKSEDSYSCLDTNSSSCSDASSGISSESDVSK